MTVTPEAITSGSSAEWAYFALTVLVLLIGQLVIFITNRVALRKDMEALGRDISRVEDDVVKKTLCITALKERQQKLISVNRCAESRLTIKDIVNIQVSGLGKDINDLKVAIESNVENSARYREQDGEWKIELNKTLSRLSEVVYGGGQDRRA